MSRTIRRLVLIAFLLVVVEGLLVGAILLSPDFRDKAGEATAEAVESIGSVWLGDDESPGYAGKLSDGAGEWYSSWVSPLWATPKPETSDGSTFARCEACHADYSQRSRFGDLYMNHTSHGELGLGCGTCHTDISHPNPLPPKEGVCATCHEDVVTGGDCSMCHAPASLPHYTIIGADRVGLIDCTTCHLPGTLTGSDPHPIVGNIAFDGNDHQLCLTCHQERTCQTCHDSEHPPDWVDVHGTSVGPRGPIACTTCHTINFCSDACHAGRAGTHQLPIERSTGGNE